MKILAIETSCDETAAAVITEEAGRPRAISNVVSSQIEIHKEYGGVVPEVAARAHIEAILPVIKGALEQAHVKLNDLDYIATTFGPGLIGSLVVGVETAKGLSVTSKVPAIAVNHLEGHIYANFLANGEPEPEFPLLALLVSGGHTLLVLVKKHLSYEIVGQTWDDAAGEAFDKAAKAMGLPYPGGPVISALAQKGEADRFQLPVVDLTAKPTRSEDGFLVHPELSLDFSFSGLKTALISKVKAGITEGDKKDLAASFEAVITKTLVQNTERAINKYRPKSFILSGGVAANQRLRKEVTTMAKRLGVKAYVPALDFCTDNAAMIGAAAFYHIKEGLTSPLDTADPSAKLKQIS